MWFLPFRLLQNMDVGHPYFEAYEEKLLEAPQEYFHFYTPCGR